MESDSSPAAADLWSDAAGELKGHRPRVCTDRRPSDNEVAYLGLCCISAVYTVNLVFLFYLSLHVNTCVWLQLCAYVDINPLNVFDHRAHL